jgi:hypothetical protein
VVQTSPHTDRRSFRDRRAHDRIQAKPSQPTAVPRSSATDSREKVRW